MERDKLTRANKITYTITDGTEVLTEGAETAQYLWNYMRHAVFNYNRWWARRRNGCLWSQELHKYYLPSLAGKLPPYPGKWVLGRELRDYWAGRKLSDRCYTYTVQEFDVAMRSWFANLKNNPKARPPRRCDHGRTLTFELGRNAKHLGDWCFRLTVLGGHITNRHAYIKIHIRPGLKVRDIKLIRLKQDGTGTVVYYIYQQPSPGTGIAGVDLGIINLATVAFQSGESILYSGRGVLSSDRYHQKRAAKCKPSNWRPGKADCKPSKRAKRYLQKAGNIRRLAVHNLTRHIIGQCTEHKVNELVIGDLRHIRDNKNWGKSGNQRLHAWPFAEIVRQLEYKGKEAGIKVTKVNERNTSKTCHVCGTIGTRRRRGLLVCHNCGVTINADVNGAFNILNKVSPAPVRAGVGVVGVLPTRSSSPARTETGEARLPSQIEPTWVARFDLRTWVIVQSRCDGISGDLEVAQQQM